MGTGDPRGAKGRLPALSKVVVVDTYKGIARVRKWPEPRRGKGSKAQLYWQEWFRQANLLAKYATPLEVEAATKATKGTPWMPRDVMLKAMRGRLWSIGLEDGRVLYSRASYMDISQRLNIISEKTGALIVRDQELWVPLLPGPAGYVLTSQGEDKVPSWQPGGGGGGAYSPPSASLFTTWINQLGASAENAPTGPLVVSRPPAGTGINVTIRAKDALTTPWEVIQGFRVVTGDIDGNSGGIALRNSANGRLLLYRLLWGSSVDDWMISVDRYNNPNDYSSTVRRLAVGAQGAMFYRVTFDGTTIRFYYSSDVGNWLEFTSEPVSSYILSIDQYGPMLMSPSPEQIGTTVSIIHWQEA